MWSVECGVHWGLHRVSDVLRWCYPIIYSQSTAGPYMRAIFMGVLWRVVLYYWLWSYLSVSVSSWLGQWPSVTALSVSQVSTSFLPATACSPPPPPPRHMCWAGARSSQLSSPLLVFNNISLHSSHILSFPYICKFFCVFFIGGGRG